jgi:hypothetical protein
MGVLAVVLWILGVVVLGEGLDDEASGQELAGNYEDNANSILAGAFLTMVGTAAFVLFLGGLRARIHAFEAGVGRLAATVFGAGLVTAAMSLAFPSPEAAGAFAAQNMDRALEPGAAEAFSALGDGFFIAAEAAAAAFFLAVGYAILRTRALPVWFGWLSLVLGVAALIPMIGWAAYIWGLPLWVLIASIWLLVRGDEPETARSPVVT